MFDKIKAVATGAAMLLVSATAQAATIDFDDIGVDAMPTATTDSVILTNTDEVDTSGSGTFTLIGTQDGVLSIMVTLLPLAGSVDGLQVAFFVNDAPLPDGTTIPLDDDFNGSVSNVMFSVGDVIRVVYEGELDPGSLAALTFVARAAVVPVPPAALLLLTGAAGLCFVGRRRVDAAA